MRKKLYMCTSTFSALNYHGGIFFKFLSYLQEVVGTNFSANFWTFRNFRPQFRESCGLVRFKGQSMMKKRCKDHHNRPINRDKTYGLFKVCHRRTNSAPASERDRITKKTYKHHISAPTAGARSVIFPKLCIVIELIVPIIKGVVHFSIQRIVFLKGARKILA